MNENQTIPQPEKGLDDKRKAALLRYIGIMFLVAFLFVLVSLASKVKSSEAIISHLNQSSTSALENAEHLQDHNRQLEKDNAYLQGRMEELEKNLEAAEVDLSEARDDLSDQTEEIAALKSELTKALEALAELQTAYDQLQAEVPAE